jgi:hypothetical protein
MMRCDAEQLANTAAAGGHWMAQKHQNRWDKKAQNRWALATDKMGERGPNFHFLDERAPKLYWIVLWRPRDKNVIRFPNFQLSRLMLTKSEVATTSGSFG